MPELPSPRASARLTVREASLERLPDLPEATLVHAGFALPFCRPERFDDMWGRLRTTLRPGGSDRSGGQDV